MSGRITLIAKNPRKPEADWQRNDGQAHRVVFADAFLTLAYMVQHGMREMNLDIERFVIDRAASHSEFLGLLSRIPEDFRGDILDIMDDGNAFLSTTERGGGRSLYPLSTDDVRFYLEANDLVTGRVSLVNARVA